LVSVKQALAELIPLQEALLMYEAYDIIGDLVVTKVPFELAEYEREVGEAIHKAHPNVRRVFRVIGKTEEVERSRRLKLIWSESQRPLKERDRMEMNPGRTVYKEHGCRFAVDVENVFFTPRLSYERMRIAKQVKPREVIANIFGGVGTYAVIIAKTCPQVGRVYTVDVNPYAHQLAKENVIINRCPEIVVPILGDAKEICKEQLKGLCDRVIMPLPKYASSFLDCAITALKGGVECTVNYYAQISGKEIERQVNNLIQETIVKMEDLGVKTCKASAWRIVREIGPRRYHIVMDLKVVK
jgi:tRNA (guanine37-N1)-methyltransferase